MSKDATEYTNSFAAGLELTWGEGFMSPGGISEHGQARQKRIVVVKHHVGESRADLDVFVEFLVFGHACPRHKVSRLFHCRAKVVREFCMV